MKTASGSTMANSTGCPMFHPGSSLQPSPGLLSFWDSDLIDKLQHFDREQLAPRNVHALGSGAFGKFVATQDVSKYTCADLFTKGHETEVAARLSGVFVGREEAETVRDMRGFALKFYTEEGNWDLLTVNVPVFGVSDIMSGPDAIHAFKRDPRTGEWNWNTVWDYVVNHPEGLHQTLLLLLDKHGTPKSYRGMNTFACNTFSFINKEGARHWVRFHLSSDIPEEGFPIQEARRVAGEDPDFLRKDLRKAIESKQFPKWKLCFQIVPEKEGLENPWMFDATKYWCMKTYPMQELGYIELNRNPRDHFTEIEQIAFSPSSVVPGIGFSPDLLLQGRLFLYPDTQYHRLGPNYRQIPVNAPRNDTKFATPYFGGPSRQVAASYPAYSPSDFGGLKTVSSEYTPTFQGFVKTEAEKKIDHFDQIRETCLKTPENHLAKNIAGSLVKISKELVGRVYELLEKVDRDLKTEVEGLVMEINKPVA